MASVNCPLGYGGVEFVGRCPISGARLCIKCLKDKPIASKRELHLELDAAYEETLNCYRFKKAVGAGRVSGKRSG